MTLVVTEISNAGIAMVAESMISYRNHHTGALTSDKEYRQKLFKVHRIKAGAAYWGSIGSIPNFTEWIRDHIAVSSAATLREFAEGLAHALNCACGHRPLAAGKSLGVHVAGFADWGDGTRRPTFFHVHNGDLHTNWHDDPKHPAVVAKDPTGQSLAAVLAGSTEEAARRSLLSGSVRGSLIYPEHVEAPRGLFTAELDFPRRDRSITDNAHELHTGYVTRNGDYFELSLQQQHEAADRFVRTSPAPSYPEDPNHDVAKALQRLHGQLQTLLDRTEKQAVTYGGKIWTLGIDAQERYAGCDERLG